MECKFGRNRVFASGVLTIFSIGLVLAPSSLGAYAASSFGIDYRHLTTVSPGGTPDTTTTIAVGSGTTGTFIVNPFTSGSTATGTPSTTSLSGYGWRTAGVVGSSIPAGTWSFTVTTQANLTSILADGKLKVFAYSTDTIGSNLAFIGSTTGTNNVFAVLAAQTETVSFSAASVDLTNRVLVLEYWIDVTTGPLLATTVTFQAASSTQTVVLPSSSGTFYLGNPSLFSIGESESAAVSGALSRSLALTRALSDSPIILDSSPSRTIAASRAVAEVSGALVTDSVSKFKGFLREISETSGAAISAGTSSAATYSRQVAEISSAVVTDGTSRIAEYSRQVSETSAAALDDSVSRLLEYTRNATEASGAFVTDGISRVGVFAREVSETSALISSLLNAIFSAFNPPSEDEDRGSRGGGRGGGGFAEVDEPILDETPPMQDEPSKGRHLVVEVSDTIEIETEENLSFGQGGLDVTISATLNAISTSFQPIPPSAVGSVTLDIVNNANTTEYAVLHYWCVDEGTGLRVVEGTEAVTLPPHQSFSKSLDITFLSPGEFSLGASVSRSDGNARGMTAMQITVPWIAVYLSLLVTMTAGASAAIGSCALIIRRSRRKRSMN